MTEFTHFVLDQKALDKAIAVGEKPECWGAATFRVSRGEVCACGECRLYASGSSIVRAMLSARVRARDNVLVYAHDDSIVVASGRAIVIALDDARVIASENATVYATDKAEVRARGNCTIIARDETQITARGDCWIDAASFSNVIAHDRCRVLAYDHTVVEAHDASVVFANQCLDGIYKLNGDARSEPLVFETPADWCAFYGVAVNNDIAILYKAVDDDFSTNYARPKQIFYTPVSTPVAPDWDGGAEECGGGLHFSPWPALVYDYMFPPVHIIACPVRLDDMAVFPQPEFPTKIKARAVSAPCFEVDLTVQSIYHPKWRLENEK